MLKSLQVRTHTLRHSRKARPNGIRSPLRRLALAIDDRLGGGKRLKPNDWWAAASGGAKR